MCNHLRSLYLYDSKNASVLKTAAKVSLLGLSCCTFAASEYDMRKGKPQKRRPWSPDYRPVQVFILTRSDVKVNAASGTTIYKMIFLISTQLSSSLKDSKTWNYIAACYIECLITDLTWTKEPGSVLKMFRFRVFLKSVTGINFPLILVAFENLLDLYINRLLLSDCQNDWSEFRGSSMQVVSCKNRICLKYIQPDMQTDEFHYLINRSESVFSFSSYLIKVLKVLIRKGRSESS
jgi:hypothetical protein